MALINEGGAIVLEPVSVRSIRLYRHQNDGVIVSKLKVHAALKAYSFALAHFQIRNDFVSHESKIFLSFGS